MRCHVASLLRRSSDWQSQPSTTSSCAAGGSKPIGGPAHGGLHSIRRSAGPRPRGGRRPQIVAIRLSPPSHAFLKSAFACKGPSAHPAPSRSSRRACRTTPRSAGDPPAAASRVADPGAAGHSSPRSHACVNSVAARGPAPSSSASPAPAHLDDEQRGTREALARSTAATTWRHCSRMTRRCSRPADAPPPRAGAARRPGRSTFYVHAEVAIAADDRAGLERVCRYLARPPLAQERLERLADGRLRCGSSALAP